MGYDSRRWTGRYAPGEMPPEFAGVRPYRSPYLRWKLLGANVCAVVFAIGELWIPSPHQPSMALLWFLALGGLNVATDRSPFARAGGRAHHDEFERATLMLAKDRAYTALTVIGAGALFWCGLATAYGWPMPYRWGDWATWALALIVVGGNLPVMLAEFMVPMPDTEDATS